MLVEVDEEEVEVEVEADVEDEDVEDDVVVLAAGVSPEQPVTDSSSAAISTRLVRILKSLLFMFFPPLW